MKRKTRHRIYHGPHGDRWLKAVARTTTSEMVRDVATRLITMGIRNPYRYADLNYPESDWPAAVSLVGQVFSRTIPAGQVAACAFLARQAIGVFV